MPVTNNLRLSVTPRETNKNFIDWRLQQDGPDDSNMIKLDKGWGDMKTMVDGAMMAAGHANAAPTKADMTDHDKVYVYTGDGTGDDTGMENGHWYYWDGTDWASGGVYQATAIETDETLKVEGEAADAKATGEMIIVNGTSSDGTRVNITTTDEDVEIATMEDVADLKSAITEGLSGEQYFFNGHPSLYAGNLDNNTGEESVRTDNKVFISDYINQEEINYLKFATGYAGSVLFYDDEKVFINSVTWNDGQGKPITLTPGTPYANTAYLRLRVFKSGFPVITADMAIKATYLYRNNAIYSLEENTETSINALTSSVDYLDNLLNISSEIATIINGYDSRNTTQTSIGNSPFIYKDISFDSTQIIKSVKINVKTAGTLSLGVVAKSDVSSGRSFDRSNITVKETITISSTGVNTIPLTTPFTVSANEFLTVGMPSDTCVWYYGMYGTDTGFFYISNNTASTTTSSVGLDIIAEVISTPNARPIVSSVYKGKTLSILGDSISTYSGYIPQGNETYYPSGTVQAVTDTWWKKLIDALGMTLNVNNSWSGSRVTTTGGADSAGCGSRSEALGTSPDVIIVWMGINDFNDEVGLGTYDGKSAIPETTTTFREAYAIMLNKILTKYQSAEVWICTLPQCERNGESGFPEINGNNVALADFNEAIIELARAFGVKVLDHNACGLTYQNMPTFNPDNLHPNKYGHSLVANNDIRQMDNAVPTRYPISA